MHRDDFRILLIFPPGKNVASFSPDFNLLGEDYGHFPPLGLLYLASSLRARGFGNIKVVDTSLRHLTVEQVGGVVEEFRPHLVGITAFTVGFGETVKIATTVKRIDPQIHVCVGGPHVKVFPRLTIEKPTIDSIVLGEGEDVLADLADALVADAPLPPGVITLGNYPGDEALPVQRITDLDRLPFPARDLMGGIVHSSSVGIMPKSLSIITSRGCPFSCTFCDVPFKKVHYRSIGNVMDEIESCRPDRDTEIFFYDETLNIVAERFTELCRETARFRRPWSFRARMDLLDDNLLREAKQSGCFQLHFGLETTNDEGLAYLRKGITMEQARRAIAATKRAGIRIILNLMIVLPFEKTEADIQRMMGEVIALDPYMVQINVFEPIPGTAIFEDGVRKGILSWRDWEEYVRDPHDDFVPKTWDEHIEQAQVGRIWQNAYRTFYMRPGKILRYIFSVRTFSEFLRMFRNARQLLK